MMYVAIESLMAPLVANLGEYVIRIVCEITFRYSSSDVFKLAL